MKLHSLLAGHEVEHLVHQGVEVLHFLAVDAGRALDEQGCLSEGGGGEAGIKGDREAINLQSRKNGNTVPAPRHAYTRVFLARPPLSAQSRKEFLRDALASQTS